MTDNREDLRRARLLLQRGAADKAAEMAESLVAENPDDSEVWSVLGAAYFELEEWEKAEEAARQITSLSPDSARAWSNLGTILRKRGMYEQAASAQKQALSIDTRYRRAEAELRKCKVEQHRELSAEGWKIRVPDGDFIGPVSTQELYDLVATGEVEPSWKTRGASGRVVTVSDALGRESCAEALSVRVANLTSEVSSSAGATNETDNDRARATSSNLVTCGDCGGQVSKSALLCPHCGAATQRAEERARKLKSSVAAALIGLAILAFFFGSYHIVATDAGPLLVRKVHFTFSEVYVPLEAITGMPYVMAKAKYPLAVQALQRDGILETDEEFERRVRRETEQAMDRYRY